MKSNFNCDDIRELMPDLAAGVGDAGSEVKDLGVKAHLQSCAACSTELESFRRTMALLDEWKAPEPSPYFDVRMQAKLREEIAATKRPTGWLHWLRKPVFAVSLTVALVAGVTLVETGHAPQAGPVAVEPGTAVGDLQALDKNHDLYSDFDVLDDLQVQSNVVANP
jgi:predicted anti-sigma-YlaC factor YlaD